MESYTQDEKRTKSLERAEQVIDVLRTHRGGDPVPVQEIAEQTGSYYEEALHVVTTLEALGIVERFRREGAPRDGARIAYKMASVTKIREARKTLGLDSRARTRRGDTRGPRTTRPRTAAA